MKTGVGTEVPCGSLPAQGFCDSVICSDVPFFKPRTNYYCPVFWSYISAAVFLRVNVTELMFSKKDKAGPHIGDAVFDYSPFL